MRTTRPLVAIAMGGALVLSACSNGSNSPGADNGSSTGASTQTPGGGTPELGEAGGTVTMAITDDPGNLDPSMTVLQTTRGVGRMAYDSLVRTSPEGEMVPNLATEWEVTPTSVTFTLNPDATCADGTPFTATDAADNISFITDPENASPLLGVMVPPDATASADDEAGTVTVEVSAPNAFLLSNLTSVFMVCRSGLDDRETLAQATAGTGPWVLEEVVPNDSYTLVRNENYHWGPSQEPFEGEGVPDTFVFRVIPNMTTTANLLLNGEINIASVGPGDEERVQAAGLDRYGAASPLGETFFNQGPGHPGADPAVRKALVAATDIEMVTAVGAGAAGQVSTGLVTLEPKVCPGDTVTGNLPAYDVEAANTMLDDAGWVRGADGIREKEGNRLSLKFIFPQRGGDELSAAAELLSQQWREVGAEVSPSTIAATQLNEVIFGSGDWDAGWIPVTVSLPPQLMAFLSGPAVPDGTNFAHIDNETYTTKSAEANAEGDIEAACALWTEAETALIENVDVAPMFDIVASNYLNGVTLEASSGEIDGSSVRSTQ
ncbi:ABC transporter substrate-binding protein [Ornithinimicrobium sufpigmenti]|uniref:ABC transporter substrate-binding protein n=1 Tax=Ornithinimicrobium sufpigmenti TaxID=2508882 RepID=UPI0015E16DD6|nr:MULTISPECIES: ABC transporter substrate-binding protein [unclassified Ornithinimicrobium]